MFRSKGVHKGRGKRTYAFIVDGDTEKWYLQMLRANEDLKTIAIKPELARKTLDEQFQYVKSLADKYDKCIWIVDLDTVIRDAKESKAGEDILNKFKFHRKELRKIDNVEVLVNTPCLEYWFLMHILNSGKYFPECDPISKELKKSEVLSDYIKTEKYFKTPGKDIYKRLRPYLSNAIKHAQLRGGFDEQDFEKGRAEIYEIFNLLNIQV